MAQYISFYHGRKDETQEMEDWGFEGPIMGPVNISWTYGSIKLHEEGWDDFEFLYRNEFGDLCKIGDKYFGDFEVWDENDSFLKEGIEKGREVISFEQYLLLNDRRLKFANQ